MSSRKQNKKLDLIEKHTPNSPSILHVGCVGGKQSDDQWIHKQLNEISGELTGIDINSEGIMKMEEEGWEVIVADAENFDLETKFDVIAALNVIEHLSNPGELLEQADSHLNEGGKVLISTPKLWNLHHILSWLKDTEMVVSPKHTMWFDDSTFRRLIELSPFRISCHETFWWRRTPASKLDAAYLVFEELLSKTNISNKYIDYQHFYCLER